MYNDNNNNKVSMLQFWIKMHGKYIRILNSNSEFKNHTYVTINIIYYWIIIPGGIFSVYYANNWGSGDV